MKKLMKDGFPFLSIKDVISKVEHSRSEKELIQEANLTLLELLTSIQRKYESKELKTIGLQRSSYSEVSKYLPSGSKVDVLELLELVETTIILVLSDLRHTERLEEVLRNKFKHFNEEDVAAYLRAEGRLEALALIHEFSGNVAEALDAWAQVEKDLSYSKTLELLQYNCKDPSVLQKYARRCIRKNPRAIEIFHNLKYKIMEASDVVDYLRDQTDQEFPLVLTFLQDYIDRNPDSSPSLHDMLVQEYIQELFK